MFFSRRSNSLVNNVLERALRIVYDDHNSFYSEFLMTKNERTILQQNINVLMKEIYKFENDLSPLQIDYMFSICICLIYVLICSAKMGLEIISCRAPNFVSTKIKDAPFLSTFKQKIKS